LRTRPIPVLHGPNKGIALLKKSASTYKGKSKWVNTAKKKQDKGIQVTRRLPQLLSMAHKEHALSMEQSWFHLLQSHSSLALPKKVKMGTLHEGDEHMKRC
jgi:hypothetical protein